MNKFRYLKYLADGVSRYECMACRSSFDVSIWKLDWRYCPYCGMASEGLLECRSQEVPRWAYGRGGNDHDYDNAWCHLPYERRQNHRCWYFESRNRWSDEMAWGDWHYETSVRYEWWNLGNWRKAYSMLQHLRSGNNRGGELRSEYRVSLR